MSWNIEVACVKGTDADGAVPDVFMPTDEILGFEDASSVSRDTDLCVAKIGPWHVVIDVQCRLSGAVEELNTETELYIVRIAGEPLERHYVKRKQQLVTTGLTNCLKIAPRKDRDGELCAMDLLLKRTGLGFQKDLWAAKFTLYTVG